MLHCFTYRGIFYLSRAFFLAGLLLGGMGATAPAACVPAPEGLVGWWQGQGSPNDLTGINNGTLVGNVTYGPAQVDQGFVLDGAGDGILLTNHPSLRLQNLTIEAWIRRSSLTTASHGSGGHGVIFGCGWGGYLFYVQNSGILTFNRLGDVAPLTGPAITDTAWHHVAVAKSGTSVTYYLDGQAYPAPSYTGTFTFTTPIGIGYRPDDGDNSFLGTIDEPTIYNRGLSTSEVQSIYAVGAAGKCFTPTAPGIVTHPASQTAYVGNSVSFSVTASGTMPLYYQWRLEGTNLPGATASTLLLAVVQPESAGNYSVVVSNSVGTATSSNALLTVLPASPCQPAPEGLVAWWRGQGDASDQVGGVQGSLVGNVEFGPGRVGQGFQLDGNGDGIALGNPAALQLQNLTIEAWIKRASASAVSASSGGNAVIFGQGSGGYLFWIGANGTLHFNRYGDYASLNGPAITDTSWHHVAISKSGGTVTFFLDGQASPTQNYTGTFTFTTPTGIGFSAGNSADSFLGSIDEVSVYNRGLDASQVQTIYAASSGKCVVPFPAFVVSHPTNRTATIGSTATFTVVAGGTPPFAYQWKRNGTNLPGATASSLAMTNVQLADAGTYAAVVSNALNSVLSSNAILSVVAAPANLRVAAASGMAGGPVTVSVEIVANGNENALQFSLVYNPSLLTYASVMLGTNLADATMFVNTNQLGSGRLGIVLALPTDAAMAPGLQQIVQIVFNTPTRTSATTTPISFGDQPTVRQLVDKQAATLSATYTAGSVSLLSSVFEGDSSPRPNGDRTLSVSDWVLLGRYAARLDYPTNANEFQRADCAPRSTFGDGAIKVTDWVQVGRYAAAVDPLTVVGGPTAEKQGGLGVSSRVSVLSGRALVLENSSWFIGQTGTVSVVLMGMGNESALGFSVIFDPVKFAFVSASKGTAAGNATLNVNADQASSGKLGVALGLAAGALPSGNHEVLKLTLRSLSDIASGTSPVVFADQPVPREISNGAAEPLASTYQDGAVTVLPFPALGIAAQGTDLVLAWPGWATNFVLQANGAPASGGWTNVGILPTSSNGELRATLPADAPTLFYRLVKP